MKVGAEPKKVAILAGLLVIAAYLIYNNLTAGSSPGPAADAGKGRPRPALQQTDSQFVAQAPTRTAESRKGSAAARGRRLSAVGQEWTPRVGVVRPEDRPDPARTDPALRLDLLAKLQTVEMSGGERSLFEFSTMPLASKVKEPIIKPKDPANAKSAASAAAANVEDAKPAEPSKPAPPPIPLKFYGFISARDGKRAFFLNGEEIFTAGEGQMIQSRYKVIRIGINSAVLEDTQHKHQQSIPLVEEQPAA